MRFFEKLRRRKLVQEQPEGVILSPDAAAPLPIAQLEMVLAEVDRELQDLAGRQASAISRASVVLAAAGVTAFAPITADLGWALAVSFFSVVSAGFAVASIRYWPSKAARLARHDVAAYLRADPYHVQWRLTKDKFTELYAARRDLDRKANLVEGAVVMLLLAWTTALTARFIIEPLTSGGGY